MPYARYRRRTYRRPYKRRRYASTKAIATKVVKNWTPAKQIRFAPPISQFSTSGAIGNRVSANNLTNISIGSQLNQRTSDKIYISGIKIDVFADNNSTVLDRHFNICLATDISRNEVLNTTTFANMMEDFQFDPQPPNAAGTNFQYNYNSELLKVNLKRRLLLGATTVAGTHYASRSFYWKPKRPHKVQYQRVNSNVVTSGRLWLLFHLAETGGVASTDTVDFQWRAQVYFRCT